MFCGEMWLLCGTLWRNVDVLWMLCETLWRNVDVLWRNVDPPHLHISQFDQFFSPPWSVILKYAIVDVMWIHQISTLYSFLSFTFKHFTE